MKRDLFQFFLDNDFLWIPRVSCGFSRGFLGLFICNYTFILVVLTTGPSSLFFSPRLVLHFFKATALHREF